MQQIQFYYTDVNNLHKFVSVALYTSAEGNYYNDKLARLKIIGDGYGPLIYDLPEQPTFENFKTCCDKVLKELEQTPELPMSLVSFVTKY